MIRLRAGLPWALALLIVTGCATPPPEPSTETIERVVHEYLVAHPEVIVEALRAMEQRQRADARARAREAVLAQQEELLRDPSSAVAGNPQGDVTLVEFLDYN